MNELRFAARRLRHSPGFALTALLVLTIGIGLNASIFSVVDALLFRPLPFPEANRIIAVNENLRGFGHVGASYLNFLDWRREAKSLEAATVARPEDVTLTERGTATRVPVLRVSYGFFDVIGVHPAHGRGFLPQEDQKGAAGRIVITDGLWKSQFGGDPRIIGKAITLEGAPYTVTGIMPASFHFVFVRCDAVIPQGPTADYEHRGNHAAISMARVRRGVTIGQADAELRAISAHLSAQYPDDDSGWSLSAQSFQTFMAKDYRAVMLTLMAAVGLVLLIACVNLAGLMLVRASGRRRELALRKALGADAWSIMRETLSEAALLALGGGLLGLLAGSWSTAGLLSLVPSTTPLPRVTTDVRVLLFVGAAMLMVVLLVGLMPALRTLGSDPAEALKEGGRSNTGGASGNRLRGALVVAEVGLALVVALGAGLVTKSFDRLIHVDPGFEADHTLTMRVALSGPAYKEEASQNRFWRQFLESAASKPAVAKVGIVGFLPLSQNDWENGYYIEGNPKPKTLADYAFTDVFAVGGDYLECMGIALLRGRRLLPSDREDTPAVALVDEEFVRKNFPNGDPLQHRLFMSGKVRQIVGVVRHVKAFGLSGEQTREQSYFPYSQLASPYFYATVTPKGSEGTVLDQVRKTVRAIDPGVPVYDVRPMSGLVDDSTWRARLSSLLLALFAAVAMVLAGIGVYGVMAYTVAQRTQELGIRMALGASRAGVLQLVMRQAMILCGVGIVIGAIAAVPAAELLKSVLFEVSPTDAGVFGIAAIALALVGLAAGAIPALRASRTDPMQAIRYE